MYAVMDDIVCKCFRDWKGNIQVIDPFCKQPVLFPNGQIYLHEDLGTASFESPYDEVAQELLSGE